MGACGNSIAKGHCISCSHFLFKYTLITQDWLLIVVLSKLCALSSFDAHHQICLFCFSISFFIDAHWALPFYTTTTLPSTRVCVEKWEEEEGNEHEEVCDGILLRHRCYRRRLGCTRNPKTDRESVCIKKAEWGSNRMPTVPSPAPTHHTQHKRRHRV